MPRPAIVSGKKSRIAIVVNGPGHVGAMATIAALASLACRCYAWPLHPMPAMSAIGCPGARPLAMRPSRIPMEPFDFPDSDPGPHTLRAGQARRCQRPATRRGRSVALHRLCRRDQSAGPALSVGFRCALSGFDAISIVGDFTFYDNGAASQSAASHCCLPTRACPPRKAGAALDTIQTALEIDHRLSEPGNPGPCQWQRRWFRVPLSGVDRAHRSNGPRP